MGPGVDREKPWLRHRVIAEEEDALAPGLPDSAIARGGGAGIVLPEMAQRERGAVGPEALGRLVPGAVVHDHDLEVGRGFLRRERVEDLEERVRPLEGRDDDRERRRHARPEKIAPSDERTGGGALARSCRK